MLYTRATSQDATTRLKAWLDEYGKQGYRLSKNQENVLARLLTGTARSAFGGSSRVTQARVLLLEAAGWGFQESRPKLIAGAIRAQAQDVLRARLKAGRGVSFVNWMLYDVLPSGNRYSSTCRIVAIHALSLCLERRSETQDLLIGIMSAGRNNDSIVRQSANEALLGRPEPYVSDYFLSALKRGSVSPETFLEHLEALDQIAPQKRAAWWKTQQTHLLEYVTSRLQDKNWRVASRGIAVARAFELKRVAPYLIEGLGVWSQRGTSGRRRIEHEFGAALSSLSGRNFGKNALAWALWWQAEIQASQDPNPAVEITTATFFGLRPSSDHLLFVIDRSSSMQSLFGSKRTRYTESVDQMLYTLRDLGPMTQFGVVLFSDDGLRFSDKLESADEETLNRLEKWATAAKPNGGTNLRSGFEAAFPGLEQGRVFASSIPFDTVVILCDGATQDSDWVAPWLTRYNLEARLKFHCVNIGGQPGGALEMLAEGSNGAFVISK